MCDYVQSLSSECCEICDKLHDVMLAGVKSVGCV